MRNSVGSLTSCFTDGLLLYLETDGEVIGYSAIQIYNHIKDRFLLPRDLSWEITKTKTDLKVSYYPNNIVQVYYKKLSTSMLNLAALGDLVTEVEIMRCSFETFEVQTDLKESC